MNKPTREQIIKALRCTSSEEARDHKCDGCPYWKKENLTEAEKAELGINEEEYLSCDIDRVGLDAADLLEHEVAVEWRSAKEQPTDDGMKLVVCKTKAGLRTQNRAYFDGASWHGSGSMAGVTHWAEMPTMPEEDAK